MVGALVEKSGDTGSETSLTVVPNLLAPGTDFMEDNFSTDQAAGGSGRKVISEKFS